MKKSLLLIILFVFACKSELKQPKAAVVSARTEASKIGISILEQGGNAFDAMIATDLALAVCYPFAGNIGGGGFIVYRQANGEVGTLDFREKAPSASFRNMFLDKKGNVIPEKSTLGGLAVGVPGTVAGLAEIHKKFGVLPWKQLVQPAIELAENGYIVTEKQASNFEEKRSDFIKVNSPKTLYATPYRAGEVVKNPAMAKTLRLIAKNGRDGFYKGIIANAIVNRIKETGGVITHEDLESYTPIWRDPVQFSYKDLTIFSMAPPSSGGICLGQILEMIAPYPIKEYGHNTLKTIQVVVEAERRSYADRSKYLGDPDFVNVPVQELLDTTYLKNRMRNFSFEQATPSSEVSPGTIEWSESEETTHYSIVDSMGNAIAVTTTLNGAYGSKVFVESGGFFLNNEMDDFSSKQGVPNMFGLIGSEANAIEPGKRMLSSMTPTIVEKNGKLSMILGTPGGSTIITSVLQTILNVYEFGMTIQEAVNAPRFHHQWLPDDVVLEPNRFDDKLIEDLTEKGYDAQERHSRVIGRVDAIYIDSRKAISAGADPRGDDATAYLY